MTTESIPTRLLVWHEQTDPTKLLRITDAIRRGDPLPPIEAMAIGHRFLVLDGAHRAQAHQYCHRSEIRARLHNLPLSAEVPGWSHSIPRDAAAKLAHLLLPVDALGQAEVVLHGVRRQVGTGSQRPRDIFLACHRIARVAYAHGIRPLGPEFSNAPTIDAATMTWRPPNVGTLWAIASSLGPLPATVTRFAPILRHDAIGDSAMTPVTSAA